VVITRGHVQPLAFHRAAEAEQRHDHAEAEFLVEIGAADAHAVIGENIGGPVSLAMALGSEADNGKIRRAAADIGDQGHFLAGNLALIVERGCDRLELEADLIEADLARDLPQRLLGLAVGIRRVVDEMHRAAMHHIAQFAIRGLFGAPLHRSQIIGDHVAKSGALPSQPRGFLDQRGAEHGFEAAHQAARRALDIGVDRLAADQHGAVHFVKDRAGYGGVETLQRHQHRHPAFKDAKRGVRSSKIKSAD
jgi:hypothetical protein